MYSVLLIILGISIAIFMVEAAYVMCNLSSRIHASLLLYILCCLVNNVGYMLEMTAKSSEAAYTATRILYLGKMNIALALLIFMLQYCKVNIPRFVTISLVTFHQILYGIVLTNDWNHLYYSSIRFETSGLFPHNVYGHGPVYYLAMLIPYIYLIFCLVILIRTYRKLRTPEEKRQMAYLLVSPSMSMIGTLVFFTGKTGGFDTGNIGLIFSALFMLIPLFKYQLIDTVDMVKNSLADSLVDGLIAIDAYGEMSYFNDIAKNLVPELALNSSSDEVTGIVENLENKALTKEILTYEDRSYVVRIQELYQGKFYRGRVYVLADVTDSLRYTKRIEEERDRADRANEAKSRFLSTMSHEIRTPINAVLGMDTMILRNSKDKEILKYAGNIQSAGKSLLSIINDILDFSKMESGKLELIPSEYDFIDVINDVYNMISLRTKEKNLEFEMIIDENIPCRLYGDDVRIRQILVNLLTNAVKYTHSGKVALHITENQNDNQTGKEKVSLHFAVTDTGIGIKPEDISKLTEEFVRIEESRNRNIEGTGLGINIVVSLLEMMESTLGVSSVYGEGSEFYFDLSQPVINSEGIGNINEGINRSVPAGSQYKAKFCIPDSRILVVDDNAMNIVVFKCLLEGMKCQIDTARSGFECLDLVKMSKYDIIFMDHMMPEMDGIETLRHMKKLGDYINADTPVVILTANAISGAREEYLSEGFCDYLSKPIVVDKLETMIERLIPDEMKCDPEKVSQIEKKTLEDIDLPYIDGVIWRQAIAGFSSEDALLKTLKNYSQMSTSNVEALDEMYDEINKTLDRKAFDNYRIHVHAMKNNAATIGAVHVAGLAKYLEYAARDYNIETINGIMPVFRKEWNGLKDDIDNSFGFAHKSESVDSSLPKLDESSLIVLLDSIKKALDEFDLDRADAVIDELSGYSYTREQQLFYNELKMGVLNIDTSKCEEIIEKWKKQCVK